MNRILVIAAHPDDEILGCGGTMAAHAAAGDHVHVALMTRGLASRGAAAEVEYAHHLEAARRAGSRLGVTEVVTLDFPDNALDTVPRLELAKAVEGLVAEVDPATVYTHHGGDLNVDHRRVSEAVAIACRPQPGRDVREILHFEVASSTDWSTSMPRDAFVPNWFRDVSAHLDAKIAALRDYEHEMRPWPHARSIEAAIHLARWRGASVGFTAAEAFVLARRLVT